MLFSKHFMKLAIIAALLLSLPAYAQATNDYQIGFEAPDYQIAAISEQKIGDNVWIENGGFFEVMGSADEIKPPEGSQMLRLSRPRGLELPEAYYKFTSDADAIKDNLRYSFQVAADDLNHAGSATSALGVGLQYAANGFYGAWVGVRRTEEKSNEFGFFYKNWDGVQDTWVRLGDETLNFGEFYRFEVTINMQNFTYSVEVFDSKNISQGKVSDISIWDDGGLVASHGFNRIVLKVDEQGDTNFYLDNIKIQSPPKP